MRKKYVWAALATLLLAVCGAPLAARAASGLTVTSLVDEAVADAKCTLREAITEANRTAFDPALYPECGTANTSGADTINFAIGTGAQTIALVSSGLPEITGSLVIDGTTQPGYAGVPLIRINGLDSANTLSVATKTVTIKGLMLVGTGGTSGSAILLGSAAASYVTIQGNYIGTDGTTAIPNAHGISISDSGNNQIGGTGPGEGNLISGNSQSGIFIYTGAANNVIQGNKFGTNAAGTLAVANRYGMMISSAGANTVGGETAGAGNLISGNTQNGIFVENGTGGVVIKGNQIGTNAAGTLALPNQYGITLNAAGANTIGGESAGAGNLISGNSDSGVNMYGSSDGTVIKGNRIGVTAGGSAALPNNIGVYVSGAGVISIGGEAAGAGNVISGNTMLGIVIYNASPGTLIQGNRIGTTADGLSALPNVEGIRLDGGSGVIIGGTNAGAGNLISGSINPAHNSGYGIYFDVTSGSPPSSVTIQGNRIGTDITGTAAIPNWSGIYIQGSSHIIGGMGPGAGNLISGNVMYGMLAQDANPLTVAGNTIGSTDDGTGILSNGEKGVYLAATSAMTVTLIENRIAHHVTSAGFAVVADNAVVFTDSSGNCIAGNHEGVYRSSGSAPDVDLTGNWWGDASGPRNPASNPAGLGDRVSDNIDFSSWLTTPPADCPPGVTLPETTHTFASVVIGSTGAPEMLSVQNSGLSPLHISGSPVLSAGFALAGTDTCTGATVLPGKTCSFGVTFTPAAPGAWPGAATITHDASGSPHTITLTGTGLSPIAPPVLKSPKNGAPVIRLPAKLGWKSVKGAKGYHIEFSQDSAFQTGVTGGDSTKPKFPAFPPEFGIYFWHVASKDASGGAGAYSAALSFEYTLNKAPKKGSLSRTTTPKFAWQTVRGATYELEVYTDPGNPAGSHPFDIQTGLKKPSFKVPKTSPLTHGQTYYWRVRTAGGQWTLPWSFTVK